MKAGTLRETVVFESATAVTNEYGEEIQTWSPFYQTRAAITQLSSAQLIRAGKPEGTATFQIEIRWWPGIEMPCRVIWSNNGLRKLYVTSISTSDDVKRRTLQITAEERDDG
jgi:SPP1 family predicted phage head-tail adaptor